MEKIENEFLEREFNNNHEVHEIFKYQRNEDIDNLEKNILESNGNEILLKININNIMPFLKHKSNIEKDSEEEEKFWNHVVSILFMSQLDDKYKIESVHNVDEEKKIITRDNFDVYQKVESSLINRDDVIELIRNLNLDNPRLHIIITYFNNENVWKELVNYLEDDLPFITMIYSESDLFRFKEEDAEINDMDYPSDLYSYKVFKKSEEGIESNRLKISKNNSVLLYEKKI